MSCEGCGYAVLLSGAWCCDYLLMTGHRRPCPPGEDCTVRKEGDFTKKGNAFMKRRAWDTEKARTLYDQRLSDAEIAGKVGATASAVAFWRRGLGLPANSGQHPPPQEEPASKAVPPRPLALPANGAPAANQRSACGGERRKERSRAELSPSGGNGVGGVSSDDGSVELSVEADGCAFTLRAPDLEGAARIHECAGRLLEYMGQIAMKRKEGMDDA